MHIHTAERSYQYNQCEKGFTKKIVIFCYTLEFTIGKSNTSVTRNSLLTNILKKHMKVYTGDKPYQCSQCDKKFPMNIDTKRYLRVRTGERPYQCTQCDKAFADNCYYTNI